MGRVRNWRCVTGHQPRMSRIVSASTNITRVCVEEGSLYGCRGGGRLRVSSTADLLRDYDMCQRACCDGAAGSVPRWKRQAHPRGAGELLFHGGGLCGSGKACLSHKTPRLCQPCVRGETLPDMYGTFSVGGCFATMHMMKRLLRDAHTATTKKKKLLGTPQWLFPSAIVFLCPFTARHSRDARTIRARGTIPPPLQSKTRHAKKKKAPLLP